jgi:LmbE family N-acetylglucosaminyl deacetylase
MNNHPIEPHPSLFIPDHCNMIAGLHRTTRLGIAAHQDDLEFMALEGIIAGLQNTDEWFGGIICTDGANSVRAGAYAHYDNAAMRQIREREQEAAATIGKYAFVAQLGYASAATKTAKLRTNLVADILRILEQTQPNIVYAHNPFDKHPTHVAVCKATIEAILLLPEAQRPQQLIGCELWRGLDWLPDSLKMIQDLTGHEVLAATLNAIFDSQISGGKRYDRAIEGRRLANATLLDAFQADTVECCNIAIDLTELIREPIIPLALFVERTLNQFKQTISDTLSAV